MKTKTKDSKIKVLLLITGSISAVRIPLLVSQLAKEDYENWKLSYPWKYVLNSYINFKKLLEALLLEYIDFTQYEIHFWK